MVVLKAAKRFIKNLPATTLTKEWVARSLMVIKVMMRTSRLHTGKGVKTALAVVGAAPRHQLRVS